MYREGLPLTVRCPSGRWRTTDFLMHRAGERIRYQMKTESLMSFIWRPDTIRSAWKRFSVISPRSSAKCSAVFSSSTASTVRSSRSREYHPIPTATISWSLHFPICMENLLQSGIAYQVLSIGWRFWQAGIRIS